MQDPDADADPEPEPDPEAGPETDAVPDAGSDADPDAEDAEDEPKPKSCCAVRRKVLVGILRILPEDLCGVPDSELADVMRFDLETPSGKAVLAFRFCPWCGTQRGPDDETRITDVQFGGSGGGGSLGG